MAIEVASSFERKAGVPLDDREVLADITARNAIPALVRYEGMKVTVLDDGNGEQKLFWLKGGITNGDWKEFSSGGGGGTGLIVPDITKRNAIPNEDRKIGLTVTVLDDGNGKQKDFWLVGGITNSDWKEKPLIPAGGTAGQMLQKTSGVDYDMEWVTPVKSNLNLISSLYKKDSQSPAFVKKSATTISLKAGSRIVVKGNVFDFPTDTTISLPALNTGTDYAIYCTTAGALIASSNFTAPTGYTADDVYQIGGFHYGVVAPAETVAGGGFATSGNGMIWTQGDVDKLKGINQFSIWDLKFRPACSDPRGMALVANRFWVDIYFCNTNPEVNGTSKYNSDVASGTVLPKIPTMFGGNGTTAYSNMNWFAANEIAKAFGKRLMKYEEFSVAAFGVTENQSIGTGAVSTTTDQALGSGSNTIAFTGRVAGYTSKWGLEQATGHHYTWGSDSSYRNDGTLGDAWNDQNGGRGQLYLKNSLGLVYVLLGGDRGIAANAGSRASNWNAYPWNSVWAIGLRAACDHLKLV